MLKMGEFPGAKLKTTRKYQLTILNFNINLSKLPRCAIKLANRNETWLINQDF